MKLLGLVALFVFLWLSFKSLVFDAEVKFEKIHTTEQTSLTALVNEAKPDIVKSIKKTISDSRRRTKQKEFFLAKKKYFPGHAFSHMDDIYFFDMYIQSEESFIVLMNVAVILKLDLGEIVYIGLNKHPTTNNIGSITYPALQKRLPLLKTLYSKDNKSSYHTLLKSMKLTSYEDFYLKYLELQDS